MTADLAAVARDLAPTGTLRASINLGNPVLAQGTPAAPSGVPVSFACFDAARKSFEAMATGAADLCFLAVDPARAAEVSFTSPYVVIEGVFVVPTDSPLHSVADVDRDGVRVGVKEGSAYDLHLARTLERATIVRGAEGVDVFVAEGLEVGAGIREPVTAFVAGRDDVRLIGEPFMQIRQAVGTTRGRSAQTVAFLHDLVEELKANGFVADALARSGQRGAAVAPPS